MSSTRLLALASIWSCTTACHHPQGAQTVVVITWDAARTELLLSTERPWNTTPKLDAFFDEGTVFPRMLSPRGLTGPALSSMLTGTYPNKHGVRDNLGSAPRFHTLMDRFQDAGYTTWAYSANMCQIIASGVDHTECTSPSVLEADSRQDRDIILVDRLLEELTGLREDQPLFLWLHLAHPHDPYELVEPWYSEFHPQSYEGDLDPGDSSDIRGITLSGHEYDDQDRDHFEAVYASQLRETDALTGRVLSELDRLGRYEDAVVVFGVDHGEELGDHNRYFAHGCSPYNSVLNVVYAFRAPGVVPEGLWLDSWRSTVDVASTVVELADAFEWAGSGGSSSLLPAMTSAEVSDEPVFFERGVQTAGVVWHNAKYVYSGETEFDDCHPYSGSGLTYPTEQEELYDLELDPDELSNLAGQDLALQDELRDTLCDWVTEGAWVGTGEQQADNTLVLACVTEGR